VLRRGTLFPCRVYLPSDSLHHFAGCPFLCQVPLPSSAGGIVGPACEGASGSKLYIGSSPLYRSSLPINACIRARAACVSVRVLTHLTCGLATIVLAGGWFEFAPLRDEFCSPMVRLHHDVFGSGVVAQQRLSVRFADPDFSVRELSSP
jgi:hypothetical protein